MIHDEVVNIQDLNTKITIIQREALFMEEKLFDETYAVFSIHVLIK